MGGLNEMRVAEGPRVLVSDHGAAGLVHDGAGQSCGIRGEYSPAPRSGGELDS